MEVSEQPRGGISALNVKAIRDRCHAKVNKQRKLLADIDVAPPQWRGLDHMTGKCFASRYEVQQEC